MAEAASAAPAAGTASCRTPSAWLTPRFRLPDRPRMPRTKASAVNAGSAELNAMVARVASDILELLVDGVPRSEVAIVKALAGRHDRQDVVLTLIRLSVTGRAEDTGGKYALASGPAPDVG